MQEHEVSEPQAHDEPTGNEPTGNEPTGNEPTGNEPTGNEPTGEAGERDQVLDGFADDLDNVAAALDALDADDLDTAERLVSGLAAPEEAPVGDGSVDPVVER